MQEELGLSQNNFQKNIDNYKLNNEKNINITEFIPTNDVKL